MFGRLTGLWIVSWPNDTLYGVGQDEIGGLVVGLKVADEGARVNCEYKDAF